MHPNFTTALSRLFFPEALGEEDEDGEEFETAYQHETGENPFRCVGHKGVVAVEARDVSANPGVAYCGKSAEEGIAKRHTNNA